VHGTACEDCDQYRQSLPLPLFLALQSDSLVSESHDAESQVQWVESQLCVPVQIGPFLLTHTITWSLKYSLVLRD
jgi:hypothetical protein